MMKFLKVVIGLFLLSSAMTVAADSTMSCFVDTPANDPFTANRCFSVVYGARRATAVFRVDEPPQRFQIIWSDPKCSRSSNICTVRIRAFQPFTMTAIILDLDHGTFDNAQAIAEFENGM